MCTSMLFTCSVDKTAAIWDVEAGERIKKLKGHTSFVNSCCPTRRGVALLATGSDDGNIKVSWGEVGEKKDIYNDLCLFFFFCIKVWDVRKKGAVNTLNSTFQVSK